MSYQVLIVKNWGKFQQYKTGNPPWIKLHTSLLDDYDFQRLPGDAKWQLLLLWLIAAKQDNHIPDDREWLASLLHVPPDDLEIEILVDRGWLERRLAPNDSTKPLAADAGASDVHQPPASTACVSTTTVEANTTESDPRARANAPTTPELAGQF